MSIFSEYLSAQIARKGINYSRLAQLSGVDRTLIHHMAQGRRKPSGPEVAERLAAGLALTPEEREELLRRCRIVQIGEKTYLRRQAVQKMLCGISMTGHWAAPAAHNETDFIPPPVCCGAAQVRVLLQRLIDRERAVEGGTIDLLGQPENAFLLQLLQNASAGSELHIRHILCLDNGADAEETNLRCLGELLPTLLASGNYEAYHYYSALSSAAGHMTPFPILLLTSSCAVQLNADYTAAIVSTGPAFHLLEKHFQESLRHCRPLARAADDLGHYLENYGIIWDRIQAGEKDTFLNLVPDLCCMPFLDRELLEAHLLQSLPDREVMVERLFQLTRKSLAGVREYPVVQFLCLEGVWRFLRTGRFSEAPDAFYTPISPAGRARILRRVIQEAEAAEHFQLRLYNHTLLPFPDALSLTIGLEEQTVCMNCRDAGSSFTALSLQEPSLSNAFADYFFSLLENPAVLSKQESLAQLQAIQKAFEKNGASDSISSIVRRKNCSDDM